MAPRVILPIIALTALGGCATLGEPVLDADGCRPAMTIYQPGVGPGRAGQVIHIPRSCPQNVVVTPEMLPALAVMAGAEDARREQAAGGPPAEREAPPAPVSARVAIRQGVEDFCGWFYGDQPYSLDGLRQAAFDAGYGRGAPVPFFPSPEMLREPAFSALGFTAVAENPPSDGHGVAAFVSFHHPTCQLQIYGYGADGDAVIAELEARGWRRTGEPVRSGESSWAQRYYGGPASRPMTMVVTRVAREGDGPGLDMVINVVPGEDPERGLLHDPTA